MSDRVTMLAPQFAAAVVLILTALMLALVPAPRGLYAIEGHLQLVTPNSNGGGNAYRADQGNSTLFAAAIERVYNVHPETARVASTSATLYGIGVRDGSRVTLPSAGSQWTSSFDQPYLRVEVISADPALTQARYTAIVTRLNTITGQLQSRAGVVPAARVHLQQSPVTPDVQYVAGRDSRWLAAVGLIGLIAGVGVYQIVRRIPAVRAVRSAPSRAPRPGGPPTSPISPIDLEPVSDRTPVGASAQHRGMSD